MYRIEFLPRFGTRIGIIWKNNDTDDTAISDDSIGHVRVSSKEEEEEWTTIIKMMNERLKKNELENVINAHPHQKKEQDTSSI